MLQIVSGTASEVIDRVVDVRVGWQKCADIVEFDVRLFRVSYHIAQLQIVSDVIQCQPQKCIDKWSSNVVIFQILFVAFQCFGDVTLMLQQMVSSHSWFGLTSRATRVFNANACCWCLFGSRRRRWLRWIVANRTDVTLLWTHILLVLSRCQWLLFGMKKVLSSRLFNRLLLYWQTLVLVMASLTWRSDKREPDLTERDPELADEARRFFVGKL